MRSSPKFLVESRSGESDSRKDEGSLPEGRNSSLSVSRSERPRTDDGAEINVRLRVGYKTVLLAVVIFDLVHLSLRELINASWFEQLFGLSP